MSLFEKVEKQNLKSVQPLAARMRPRSLSEFSGQQHFLGEGTLLRRLIQADRLGSVLFYGPPGTGKTTLAHVVANEMGVNVKVTAGPAIERAGDLAAILTNLRAGDVLFIDEVHRLGRAVEEVLYPAMEDFALDIVIGKGPSARSIRLKLPRFTVVGATTRLALVTAPLRVTVPRGNARFPAARVPGDDDPEHPANARYVGGQRLYQQQARLWQPTWIVDNSDLQRPELIVPDPEEPQWFGDEPA